MRSNVHVSEAFEKILVFLDERGPRNVGVNGLLLGVLGVEIFQEVGTVGHELRLNLFLGEELPVDVGKPGTLFNFLDRVSAQSLLGVLVEHSLHESLALLADLHLRWEEHLLHCDQFVHDVRVFIIEWRHAVQQLKRSYSQSPPVHHVVVSLLQQHLRG